MGRRIRYRPTRSVDQIPENESLRPVTFWTQETLIILGVIWVAVLVLIVGVAYFIMENRKFENEFAPLVDVCKGKWVNVSSTYSATPGKHPAIVVRNSSSGWSLDRNFLPDDAVAPSRAETQVVVCLGQVYEVFIENCPYHDPDDPSRQISYVERYYNQQIVRLVEAKTSRVITEQTFTGKSAHYCHETELFARDKRIKKLEGTPISEDEIKNWALSHLFID